MPNALIPVLMPLRMAQPLDIFVDDGHTTLFGRKVTELKRDPRYPGRVAVMLTPWSSVLADENRRMAFLIPDDDYRLSHVQVSRIGNERDADDVSTDTYWFSEQPSLRIGTRMWRVLAYDPAFDLCLIESDDDDRIRESHEVGSFITETRNLIRDRYSSERLDRSERDDRLHP